MESFTKGLTREIPRLQRYAKYLKRNPEDAEDLTQSALTRAWDKQDKFELGSDLGSWLRTIMRNEHVNDIRKSVNYTSTALTEEITDHLAANSDTENGIFVSEIADVIADMAKPIRDVVMMICVDGLTDAQVGKSLNIPVGTVRTRLHRGRSILRKAFER